MLAARAAFGLAFLAAGTGGIALPAYFPTERRWAFAAGPEGGIAMVWFGATGLALSAAALFAAIAWAPDSPRAARSRASSASAAPSSRSPAPARSSSPLNFVYFGVKMTHQPRPDAAPAASTSAAP